MRKPSAAGSLCGLLLLGLLFCSSEAAAGKTKRGTTSDRFAASDAPDKAVTWECIAVKPPGAASAKDLAPGQRAPYVLAAIESLERLPGVVVTGSYRGGISLMMTPNQAASTSTRSSLDRYCSRIFRSHPRVHPPVGAPARNKAASKPSRQAPPTFDQKEAVKAMLLDQVEQYNNQALTGKGVKIGILSDSFNTLGDTFFPCDAVRNTTVVREYNETGIDEGRAMAELICFVAPDAQLFFHTAFEGLFAFAGAVEDLRFTHACDVIVDDIGYFVEAWFSPDILLQAVQRVTNDGASFFSAAGNAAGEAYEGSFNPLDLSGTDLVLNGGNDTGLETWHNFGTAESPIVFLEIAITEDFLGLQWDEPWAAYTDGVKGAESDLDLWVCFDEIPTTTEALANCSASAYRDIGLDPIDGVFANSSGRVFVGVRLYETNRNAPSDIQIKLYWPIGLQAVDGQGVVFDAATTCPHGNTELAMSIGTANAPNTPGFGVLPAQLAYYSSWGYQPLYLDADGNRLDTPEVLVKPNIVAVDGTQTSFFGQQDGAALRFYGTSAAAPHAAAIAALMRQQNTSITVADLNNQMRDKADDMFLASRKRVPWAPRRQTPTTAQPTPGVDRYSGHGFLLANELLTSGGPPATCEPSAANVCCDDNGILKNGTQCSQPSPGSCTLVGFCDGVNPGCPIQSKPDGHYCAWRPHIRSAYISSDSPKSNTNEADGLLSVTPDQAAAWLTGQPAYDSYHSYEECQGVCVRGLCAPHKTHRGCCHVPLPDDYYGKHDGAGQDKTAGSRGLGYWESKEWFCWHH